MLGHSWVAAQLAASQEGVHLHGVSFVYGVISVVLSYIIQTLNSILCSLVLIISYHHYHRQIACSLLTNCFWAVLFIGLPTFRFHCEP
jgi:hypothetical protein